jgi:hypothetical protein
MKRLSPVDRTAMERAIEMLRRRGGQDAQQIEDKLARDPWERVGEFAAYACQDSALHLKPWQWPPCWLRTDDAVERALAAPALDPKGLRVAGDLVRRLLAAGLSRYEPDPIAALERIERKRRQNGDYSHVERNAPPQ